MEFKKITKVRLPFDMRHKDPNKDYGINGLQIWFVLEGPKGATQFQINASVYLNHVVTSGLSNLIPPLEGWDLGYHAKEPQYEGQRDLGPCEHTGEHCYYDGSGLVANEFGEKLFRTKGEKLEPLIWKRLEENYKEQFGEQV